VVDEPRGLGVGRAEPAADHEAVQIVGGEHGAVDGFWQAQAACHLERGQAVAGRPPRADRVDEVGVVEMRALQGEGYGRARMLPVVMMICT
jgi:hypothetical protein